MDNNIKPYINGGISGIIEITLVHPIEYFKTLKQYKKNNNNNFFTFVKNAYNTGGIRSLYYGYLPRLIGVVPMRTIFWGTMYASDKNLQNKSINPLYKYCLSGLLVGSIQTLIDCPIESLKTQMMTTSNSSYKINFNGFTPNLLRNIGFVTIFNASKNSIKDNYLSTRKNINLDNIFIGCISGITASILTQPFDYIKTKMQENKIVKVPMRKIIYLTLKNKPMLFFSGTVSRCSITCISMSIGLYIFELLNSF
uniref:Mitochondrial carrier protein n=1 Tax=viral metagenome TaxID=1070528 RepID=A0A6C0AVX1_9ZZZZ|tara:strand:+ start:4972 stop:5730 length:759 start_codon:yes stop_codon:yes gene_type:complete